MSLTFKDAKESMPLATYNLFEDISTKKDLSRWTLVGGTALSLYLKHRTSEDLDFFIEEKTFSRGSAREIDNLIDWLSSSGIRPILTDESDNLRDYMVGEVKVTFFASGLKHLKENAHRIGTIDIASIEQIAAMKLESILKYRTVTRDFFDIYTLWKQKDLNLYSLIDNYRDKYTPAINTELFERRFFDRPMDITDPGFGSLQVVNKISPDDIRAEYLSWVKEISKQEAAILDKIVPADLKETETLFGLSRQSLFQKLFSVNSHELITELVKNIEMAKLLPYEDFNGQNLFDYYHSDPTAQQRLAACLTHVPESWLNTDKYKYNPELLNILRYEHTVITQASQISDPNKLDRIADKKGFDQETFKRDVSEKTSWIMKSMANTTRTLEEALETLPTPSPNQPKI
ncbi:MAG: nucleotidyl transferase AbiEii/AbiGii toxin family protein [Epsilonproteobacteria bacterium]|nr:nucleotidyl transferase AbiEii/AbiGii toxin family protein [Campylobacterota bacterium]